MSIANEFVIENEIPSIPTDNKPSDVIVYDQATPAFVADEVPPPADADRAGGASCG